MYVYICGFLYMRQYRKNYIVELNIYMYIYFRGNNIEMASHKNKFSCS